VTQTTQEQIGKLRRAIAMQENLRGTVDDAIIDATLATLREKLAELETQAVLPSQQRKQITILFADVKGFTAMSETMDSEEVGDLMNALWREMDAIIAEYGGLIDKHMGDAVMALWGVDKAREDDPEQAIRAALAMNSRLTELSAAQHVNLAMRIGISTGPVLLGIFGTAAEFSAIGDTVNLASRLEHAAPVGGILISNDTYCHVRGVFDVQPQEPITVKGKSEPVRTYVVLRAKTRVFRVATRGVEGIETRMIGRDSELQTLKDTFHHAMTSIKTHIVTVVGDAGLGKSRLLYEFDKWIELLPEEVFFFKGRSRIETQHIPYAVIRDMFAFRFDILDSDHVNTALEKFRAGMKDTLDADDADVVGHLIGFDFSSSEAVTNLLKSSSFSRLALAYLTNYIRELVTKPTVIFLEDIQWADDNSLDLIDHLVAEIPQAKLLIVCLARPTLFERRSGGGQGDSYSRLDLQPLSTEHSQALTAEILQKVEDVFDDLRALVVNRAEGNPFYIEELIKMLIDNRVITCGEEAWHIEHERLMEFRMPTALTGVLQARLDNLPPAEKNILQRASVVGQLFWDEAVSALRTGDGCEVDVRNGLTSLRSRELVVGHEQSAFGNAHEYSFKHAILHDVTYETVLLKVRRVYHAQVAQWVEANAGERIGEFLDLLAWHYKLAGEAAKAAAYFQRSGEESYKVSAFRYALNAFEQALNITPESNIADRGILQAGLGRCHASLGDYVTAEQHFEDALALAHQANDQKTEVRALAGLGSTAVCRGAYGEARSFYENGLTLARALGHLDLSARLLHSLGNTYYFLGLYKDAQQYWEESLAIARQMDDRSEIMALCLGSLGVEAYQQGLYETAQRYVEEGLILARQMGNLEGEAYYLNSLGIILSRCQGAQQKAQQFCEESLAIRRKIGDRKGIAECLSNLGNITRAQGAHEKAQQCFEEGLAVAREINDRWTTALILGNMGHLANTCEKSDAAWSYFCAAITEAQAIGVVAIVLDALVGAAWLQAQTEHYECAAEWLGLTLNHPAADEELKELAKPALAMLGERMSANEFDVAFKRGESLELNEVIAKILAER
jgi:class 3 adenylate cyclase/predicted ATPase